MTKKLVDYIKSETKHLRNINGHIVDTCTDIKYFSFGHWLIENFNVDIDEYEKFINA